MTTAQKIYWLDMTVTIFFHTLALKEVFAVTRNQQHKDEDEDIVLD